MKFIFLYETNQKMETKYKHQLDNINRFYAEFREKKTVYVPDVSDCFVLLLEVSCI